MAEENNNPKDFNEAFEKGISQLNSAQREAVGNVYGPVMVIAGPGTGKTQLLALRVCNIIRLADVEAQNILCLTFTDAGATEMRNRLTRFLGPDAFKVGIFTYHSFCNQIIKENPKEFGDYRELSNASDLEVTETIMQLISDLPYEHPLKRTKGDVYFDVPRLKSLFNHMKNEGWSPEYVISRVEEYIASLYEDPEYRYKKKTGDALKGDLNLKKIQAQIDKYENLKYAAPLIHEYNKILRENLRIDFNDSILWVLGQLKSNPNMLAKYQERYQFFLADEYQDTNGSQNELLFLLAENEYDDRPNLFVVGDDDQSIYRFQGANMNNIVLFKERFHPVEVVMDQNYRSSQTILDKAMLLISNNVQRLSGLFSHLKKDLQESRPIDSGFNIEPEINRFTTQIAHDAGVVSLIQKFHQSGVPYNEIAVIYRSHKEVNDLIKYFSYHQIPLNVRRRVDVISLVETNRLLTMIEYVIGEFDKSFSKESLLFEILHFDFFGLSPLDIGLLTLGLNKENATKESPIPWRKALVEKELLLGFGIIKVENLMRIGEVLDTLILDYANDTPQVFFEKLINKTGLLNSILADKEKTWRLQIVNTLFDFIKSETARKDNPSLEDIIATIEKMKAFRINLPINKWSYAADGVQFMTAHGAKGLEFSHVIILNATRSNWENSRSGSNQSFSYPPNILFSAGENDIEDDRRLFYVAATRAKNGLHIALPLTDEKGKVIQCSQFLVEMGYGAEGDAVDPLEETMIDYSATLLRYQHGKASLIDHELLDRLLENLQISATSLEKYLRCPLEYYFENVLRVPMARTKYMGYGNAVHYAMEKLLDAVEKSPIRQIPEKQRLIQFFHDGMTRFKSHFTKDEEEDLRHFGTQMLDAYYDENKASWSIPREFKLELRISTNVNGIPVSGILDRLELYDDHVAIVDYKTRKIESAFLQPPKDPEDIGGKYWRQVVFYHILLRYDPHFKGRVNSATMDFMESDKGEFKKRVYSNISEDEIQTVTQQLSETYANIKAHKFSPGCGKPTCKWCNFVNQNMPLDLSMRPDLEIDEEEEIFEERE